MFTSIIGSRTEKNNDANAVMIDSRHKSKSLMRPELNAAIQDLSNWIYRHALKDFDSFHDFPEEELNEYKVGSHALNFDVIKEKLGEDLSVSNFVECFIKLLKLLDDKHIANDIFHLTDTFVKRKKRFGCDRFLGVDQYEFLVETVNRVKGHYSTKNSTRITPDIIITSDEEASFKKIRYNLKRTMVKMNKKKIFDLHINNNTVPKQLDYSKFPTPYLDTDSKFIEDYNKLIETFQKDCMNLCVNRLQEQCQSIKSNMDELISTLTDQTKIKQLLSDWKKDITVELKPEYDKSFAKATNMIVHQYQIKIHNHSKNKMDSNNNNNNKQTKKSKSNNKHGNNKTKNKNNKDQPNNNNKNNQDNSDKSLKVPERGDRSRSQSYDRCSNADKNKSNGHRNSGSRSPSRQPQNRDKNYNNNNEFRQNGVGNRYRNQAFDRRPSNYQYYSPNRRYDPRYFDSFVPDFYGYTAGRPGYWPSYY
jgi:hypothetical protein